MLLLSILTVLACLQILGPEYLLSIPASESILHEDYVYPRRASGRHLCGHAS